MNQEYDQYRSHRHKSHNGSHLPPDFRDPIAGDKWVRSERLRSETDQRSHKCCPRKLSKKRIRERKQPSESRRGISAEKVGLTVSALPRFTDSFDYLPVTAVIENQIICMRGPQRARNTLPTRTSQPRSRADSPCRESLYYKVQCAEFFLNLQMHSALVQHSRMRSPELA